MRSPSIIGSSQDVPVRGRAEGRVAWRSGSRAFRLQGSERVLRAAAAVFAPWRETEEATTEDEGGLWALESTEDGTKWVARSTVGAGGRWQSATWSSLERALLDVEFRTAALSYVEHEEGYAFHGALVSRDGMGVLILGPSHAGKSTLACALWARGWVLHSDDGALVDPRTRWALPCTRRVSIRYSSRDVLGEATWRRLMRAGARVETDEALLCHPAEDRVGERARGAVLGRIVLLGTCEDRRTSSSDRLLAVAAHANAGARRAGRAFAAAAALMEEVPVSGLEQAPVDTLVERIERHAERVP